MTEKSFSHSWEEQMQLRVSEIVAATEGKLISGPDGEIITSFCTDTRKIGERELFIPLKGERFDGHDFIGEAFQKGCIGVISEKSIPGAENGAIVIQVKDTLKALMAMAAYYRKKFSLPVIGVTGSNGKTTTKNLLASLLNETFEVLASPESYNNEIGVPLSLLNLTPSHQVAVLELAMRGKGQIKELAEIARPTIGIITNIGEAHLGLLGTKEEIARAKGELLQVMGTEGIAVLNADDSMTRILRGMGSGTIHYFGLTGTTLLSMTNLRLSLEGTRMTLSSRQEKEEVFLPLLGKAAVLDFHAAATAAYLLQVPLRKIREGAARITPAPHRLSSIKTGQGVIILDDTYNANPSSMREAIYTLTSLPCKGKRIVLAGDMLDLGEWQYEAHRELGKLLFSLPIQGVLATGDLSSWIIEGMREAGAPEGIGRFYRSRPAVKETLRHLLLPGDMILVKGSRKMEMEEFVSFIQESFS